MNLIEPSKIEGELQRIWEGLASENKMRASTFNLIVVNRLSPRTDYFRKIVQKVVEKFPCRILFVSEDPDTSLSYLKTAISVVSPPDDPRIACDQIDIGVAGADIERVPFVILPHLLPDLPIYLLWAEDPAKSHPLFHPLLQLATRAIFDSEATDDLSAFSKTLLSLKEKKGIDIADLNWARTEQWRNLIATTLDSQERLAALYTTATVKLLYNKKETPFFCHLKTQALYLLAWLKSRLQWKVKATIESETRENGGPGALLSSEFCSKKGFLFQASREKEDPNRVKIEISTAEKCELPYYFSFEQTEMGQSLVKEIYTKGTSSHFLGTLHALYREGVKNRELATAETRRRSGGPSQCGAAPQIFWPEQGALPKARPEARTRNMGTKPTPAKTDDSITSGIC